MLSQLLDEKAAANAARYPDEVKETYAQGIETVRATDIEKSAKQVGDDAIDAQLSGWNGGSFQLNELWQEGPIVLMWYRGGWYPYRNIELRAMQQSLDQIENAWAKLVVLTPELPGRPKRRLRQMTWTSSRCTTRTMQSRESMTSSSNCQSRSFQRIAIS